MAEPTHRSAEGAPLAQIGVRWCAWHEGPSATAILVRDGQGTPHPACYSCREAYDLAPATAPQP